MTEAGAEPPTTRRLWRINLVAAVAFAIGGSLFALGAVFTQLGIGDVNTSDVTYLVGGVFFSSGGYASVLQASNTPAVSENGSPDRWLWWRWDPGSRGWVSAVVLFVGTLFFAVSLVAAFAGSLTVRQSNGLIWIPDMAGCLCFLVSGHLAMLEACHGPIGIRLRDRGWRIVAINQIGSILFFLAGLAAYTRPATSTTLNLDIANWGTFLGAVCFAIGGVMQVFNKPT